MFHKTLKTALQDLIPKKLLAARRYLLLQMKLKQQDFLLRGKSTQQVFTKIYEKKMWGCYGKDYFSGHGSRRSELIEPYIQSVSRFLDSFDTPLRAVDLGCGDFFVGQHLCRKTSHYLGCDIVSGLIDRNRARYSNSKTEFRQLNIIEDPLPEADVAFLRQVLQHLSNKDIQKVLLKVVRYAYVIVTESMPKVMLNPNVDQPTGSLTRVFRNPPSGVLLAAPPFNFSFQKECVLSEVCEDEGIVLRTTLYKTQASKTKLNSNNNSRASGQSCASK
jgi:hypothetical protein